MSLQATKKLSDLDETQTIALLREYTAKLIALHERVDQLSYGQVEQKIGAAKLKLKDIDDCIAFLDLWKTMRPAARKLAQYVSQTIEHGRIDEITDLELRLRLPEYEHYFRFLDEKVKALSKYLQGALHSVPVARIAEVQRALFFP